MMDEQLKVHQVGMDEQEVLFRCAICGTEWLFNPLMFKDSPNPEKRAIIYCPGSESEQLVGQEQA